MHSLDIISNFNSRYFSICKQMVYYISILISISISISISIYLYIYTHIYIYILLYIQYRLEVPSAAREFWWLQCCNFRGGPSTFGCCGGQCCKPFVRATQGALGILDRWNKIWGKKPAEHRKICQIGRKICQIARNICQIGRKTYQIGRKICQKPSFFLPQRLRFLCKSNSTYQ